MISRFSFYSMTCLSSLLLSLWHVGSISLNSTDSWAQSVSILCPTTCDKTPIFFSQTHIHSSILLFFYKTPLFDSCISFTVVYSHSMWRPLCPIWTQALWGYVLVTFVCEELKRGLVDCRKIFMLNTLSVTVVNIIGVHIGNIFW